MTLSPFKTGNGAAMSSSPWEWLWNGDEDVATPFHAGAVSRCALYPVRGQGQSCRCWFSRNSHGVQQAIRFGKRVPVLIPVAFPNHEDPHIHGHPGEL